MVVKYSGQTCSFIIAGLRELVQEMGLIPSCITDFRHVPVKQNAYKVNHIKHAIMKAETDYLIENGFAVPRLQSLA